MKTIATIEARLNSTRLPAKVMAEVAGKPMLELLIERVSRSASIDQVVIATTTVPEDAAIETMAKRLGVGCFRGSTEDVLGRVLEAAQTFGADDVVALTGDNPLVDPDLIDDVIAFYRTGGFDYVTTTHMHHSQTWAAERTFPVGVSVQVCSVRVLADADSRTRDPVERGHGTFAIYDHPDRYRLGAFEAAGKYEAWRFPALRLTVDTPEDLALMKEIFGALYSKSRRFSTGEAIKLVAETERLRTMNRHVNQRLVYQEKAKAHG